MASKNDKIIKLTAKKFNKIRSKKLPTGIQCFLLTKDGRDVTYTQIFEVKDWMYRYNSFKETTEVSVATVDTDFRDALTIASDIQIGTVIYEIRKRDIRQPDGDSPYWRLLADVDIENR